MVGMAICATSDVCTLMWPFLEEPEGAEQKNSWLIGWNPRGLVIVVVAIVQSDAFKDACDALSLMTSNADCDGAKTQALRRANLPSPSSLSVLGRLSVSRSLLCLDNNVVESSEAWVRDRRQCSDVWIELRRGPVLDQVWCCGYNVQPCHLHVLRTDPRVRYATSPTVFSATARFGVKGVAELVKGRQPLCVAGVHSNLEGVLLPPHMIHLAAPAVGGKPETTASSLLRSFAKRVREESCESNTSLDDVRSSGNTFSWHKKDKGDQQSFSYEMEESEPLAPLPLNGSPPRLDFPTSSDSAEMSFLLQTVNLGREICKFAEDRKKKLEGDDKCGNIGSHDSSDSNKGTETDDVSAREDFWEKHMHAATSLLVSILLFVLPVLTWLGKILCIASLLEFRAREFIHWLVLWQGRTQVCGLHPALPHMVHENVAFQRFCAFNYLVRLLVDVLLGTLLSLLLAVGGNALVDKSGSFCRYFLYDLHMNYMDWFEGWPAGLKMNEDLNMTLCFFAKLFLELSWGLVVSLTWVPTAYTLLVYIAPFGASCVFALVSDICMLATMHIMFLSHVVSFLYRVMRCAMRCLFLQLRGKKYNPLRRRTDAYEFRVDQMLMGTLLFTVTVFLLPTLAVYHLYFAFVRACILTLIKSLVAAAHITLYLPVFPVIYWATHRRKWPGGYALTMPKTTYVRRHANVVGSAQRTWTTVEATVISKPLNVRIFLADFLLALHILAELRPFHVMKVIFYAHAWESTNPVESLIPHLRKNCINTSTHIMMGDSPHDHSHQ